MTLLPRLTLFALILSCQVNGLLAKDLTKVLLLGDKSDHYPEKFFQTVSPAFTAHGIELTYTADLNDLNREKLSQYAGLMIFANIKACTPEQESALVEYVLQGGGFVPVHCASYCFRESQAYINLVGAQFLSHGGRVVETKLVQPEHPILQGFNGFESWDETYVHAKHNDSNRIVLEVRTNGEQARGNSSEPWTWVRTEGKGRVFYTAWGHDDRTWNHPGFQNLLLRGTLWACNQDPTTVATYTDDRRFSRPNQTALPEDLAPFTYTDVGPKIPIYSNGDVWGTQEEGQRLMQDPLPAERAIEHYATPEEFDLELVVADPDIAKPIAINWDHRGRMWVCETVDYPNELQPPGTGNDRIRICEDTDGDGRADKFTVFAEKLSIPTSLEFCQDGVIVQCGVETIFLRDKNGDDKADEREVLISNWMMGDTHGGVSNFNYGLDNRYWAMQGYNTSQPMYGNNQQHRGFRQGPFAFSVSRDGEKSIVNDIEFIRSTTNNSWGLGISEEGLLFVSTANGEPSFFVPIPNRYYEEVDGWRTKLEADYIANTAKYEAITDKIRAVDRLGSYTAGAGHALYTARVYPKSWWNRTAFVCEPTGHIVGTFALSRDGASFDATYSFNLAASNDEWSAPIMAEVGPDGNVWIVDWYNYIVQHNPTPQGFTTGKGAAYETDLRDKTHGRVYRLVYNGDQGDRSGNEAPKLSKQNPQGLVDALKHPNRLWRRHAQRMLVELQNREVVPALLTLLQDPSVDVTNNNPAAVHALWTLHGLGVLGADARPEILSAVEAALKHPAGGVRRNAALVLPASDRTIASILSSGILQDRDSQAQLAALLALADAPVSRDAALALASLTFQIGKVDDRYQADGIICAAAKHYDHYLEALLTASAGKKTLRPAQAEIAATVTAHFARQNPAPERLRQLLASLNTAHPDLALAVADGLAANWPDSKPMELTDEDKQLIHSVATRIPIDGRAPFVKLASRWGVKSMKELNTELGEYLLSKVDIDSRDVGGQAKILRDLMEVSGDSAVVAEDLLDRISPQTPIRMASTVVRAFTNASTAELPQLFVDRWAEFTPQLRQDAIAVLLARSEWTGAILDAMEEGTFSFTDLTLDQRFTLTNHPNETIRNRATKIIASGGGSVNEDRQRVIDSYASAVHNTGETSRGREIFIKNCANCHKYQDLGQEIGPDLTGMAVHPKEELLINILDPSRSVEGNYRRYTVLTDEGVFSGLLVAENQQALEFIDAERKKHSVLREQIEQLTSTNVSLMPAGMEQLISIEEMTDLLEFLTFKGKYVTLPIIGAATLPSDRPMFKGQPKDTLIFDSWGMKEFKGVPFQILDPQNGTRPNVILLYGPNGTLPPTMPKQVSVPCNMPAAKIHFLGGIAGWGHPYYTKLHSATVRLVYEDGTIEDHELYNSVHFSDYRHRVDIPGSEFAFELKDEHQMRYLAVVPKKQIKIDRIDLVKGEDRTAPVFMAITVERPE